MKPKSKYEEALERAKRGLPIDEIFPELKESEDERIRNEMLNSLKEAEDSIVLTPFKKKSWITYLERQKEQKPIKSVPIKSPSDEEIIDALLHHLSEQDGILTAIDGVSTKAIMGYLERQKEQKLIPKFKVGDRIYDKRDSYNRNVIREVGKDYYINAFAQKMDMVYTDANFEFIEHLDNDLIDSKSAEWSEEDENKIERLAFLVSVAEEKEMISPSESVDLRNFIKSIRPRTKQEWSEDYSDEDLRTRFAFYTYKDEDDVLYLSNVFVEETSRNKGFGTKILAAAEKVAETIGAISIRLKVKKDSPANAWYRKHGYGYVAFEDGYDWLEKTLEYLKPIKPEWSEEDKEMLDYAIDACDAASDCYSNSQSYVDAAKWLKSLPARFSPQPKQEWSEEDEANFAWFDKFFRAESVVANGRDIPQDKYLWFKSLRPSWKPSKEQMDDLSTAEAILREFGYDMVADEITSLHEGLKKL